MKKLSLLLALVVSFTMFSTACGKTDDSKSTNSNSSSSSLSAESESSADDKVSSDSSSAANTTPIATEMITTSKTRYGYNTLSDDEKEVYDKLLAAIYNVESKVDFGKEIKAETYTKVFTMLYFQETQLFWFLGRYDLDEFKSGTSPTATLQYNSNKDAVGAMQAEVDAKVKEVTSAFPANATTVDKLKVIHDFLARNNTFNKDPVAQTIYGAIVMGQSQCEGYAKSIGYLCDVSGIENLLIVGTNDKELSHAWNMVKIDNEWYNIDVTWDDPEGHDDPSFVLHNYFNVTDAEILNISHFQDLETTGFTPPKATATKANYFINYKLYASSADEAVTLMQSEMIKSATDKHPVVEIKCSSKAVYEAAHTAVLNKALEMQDKSNSTSGTTKITALADGSDENTFVIRINLTF